jgi:hypothetical protein
MSTTANSSAADDMTLAERRAHTSLTTALRQAITGCDPKIACHALLETAAAIVASYAESPTEKARSLANEFIAAVERPLDKGAVN